METLSATPSAKLDLSRFQMEKAWAMAQAFSFLQKPSSARGFSAASSF
jgi:hypothetical protein